ncbi:hypothetical Protein YC6258_02303 [Gynuella sunshinyii YC6258]|uniref:Uncharacterized protein n=1 Tax=Gynuella sunshinyii YC6258 TaxID=1445510 RepID=A0A0C5VJA0_9GAMM|nr:hypothetical Protein YC6258_02303 [Gynuella sunshinyii YC6258]
MFMARLILVSGFLIPGSLLWYFLDNFLLLSRVLAVFYHRSFLLVQVIHFSCFLTIVLLVSCAELG